jgi:DNA-binding NarL/FixJ family response regulator
MKSHTILLCDDHTAVREGLRLLLEDAEDLRVVGDMVNGFRAVRETKRLLPDVVLVDFSLPLATGLETARQIVREVPSANLLMLSALTGGQHVRQAIEAGATGYLTKDATTTELLRAVREVAAGNAFFSPRVASC